MPPEFAITGLEWTEEAEAHVERHIDAGEIDDLVEAGSFFAFRNTRGHPPGRWRVIGRTRSGRFVTAVLEEPDDGDPGRWRPITGWPSTEQEIGIYRAEANRLSKKRGKRHGT